MATFKLMNAKNYDVTTKGKMPKMLAITNKPYKVVLCDYTQYEEGRGSNGGCYAFYETWHRTPSGKYEVHYGTSAEFEYCPCCGSFDNHYEGGERYSCGSFRKISKNKLKKLLRNFKEDENNEIVFYFK